ncbi:hypothetical protein OHB56_04510 [Streptomyces sp. NBC_01635]|uniref:hypothetical protein n=1 Tax=Streptomyces sp. NBC_01635 TaxID=2975904 RepID=UPI00386A4A10|nr:hypothetical protein OHB56_04510 [Streptomyces sp. NBC_01635]
MPADTAAAKAADTVAVLEEAGRRHRAHRRYGTHHQGVTTWGCGQAVSVVVTALEQPRERGADTAVRRRLGCDGTQTPTTARDAWKAGTPPPVPDLGGVRRRSPYALRFRLPVLGPGARLR